MFLRIVRAPGGNGATYEYVRVVEAYRHKGKTKHRTIINLGRTDLLAEHLDLEKLARLLMATRVPTPPYGPRTSTRSAHGIGDRCWWRELCGRNWGLRRRWTAASSRTVAKTQCH